MDAQLGMLYMWARVENKTIVKNIIERTQDELAQEFLSKYQQMENKEKFAFRKVKMSEGVEVEFIKLLTSVETKMMRM